MTEATGRPRLEIGAITHPGGAHCRLYTVVLVGELEAYTQIELAKMALVALQDLFTEIATAETAGPAPAVTSVDPKLN